MAKTKQARYSTLVNKVARMSRRNMFIVAAFVLVFVGIGTVYIGKSQASGYYCTTHTYSYDPGTYHYCVYRIQLMLQVEHQAHPYTVASPGSADGYFGSNTKHSVQTYQNIIPTYQSGVVGAYSTTWSHLCRDASRIYGITYAYDAGCNNWPGY